MNVHHIWLISWGSEVGTLPPCWDLLRWVGRGTLCELALKLGIAIEDKFARGLNVSWILLGSKHCFKHPLTTPVHNYIKHSFTFKSPMMKLHTSWNAHIPKKWQFDPFETMLWLQLSTNLRYLLVSTNSIGSFIQQSRSIIMIILYFCLL